MNADNEKFLRIMLRAKLAIAFLDNLAADHMLAETGGSYEQRKSNMEKYFERREAILKSYPPNADNRHGG